MGDDLWQDYNKCTGVQRLFKLDGKAYYKISMPGAMEPLKIYEEERSMFVCCKPFFSVPTLDTYKHGL